MVRDYENCILEKRGCLNMNNCGNTPCFRCGWNESYAEYIKKHGKLVRSADGLYRWKVEPGKEAQRAQNI